MIYLTTFILALFFTHIACALPQECHDPVFVESSTPDPYDAQYNSRPGPIVKPHATYSEYYDRRNGLVKDLACAGGPHGFLKHYKKFGEIPHFPFIGGTFTVKTDSPNCGECWKLTNAETNVSIFIIFVDTSHQINAYNISETAYKKLNGGKLGNSFLAIIPVKVPPSNCGF